MQKPILTKDVIARIPALVAQGLKADAIAEMLGCKVSTLKVRCSQEQISLRPGYKCKRGYSYAVKIRLDDNARKIFRQFAHTYGISESVLATRLLETIALDNLFVAVLDSVPIKEAA